MASRPGCPGCPSCGSTATSQAGGGPVREGETSSPAHQQGQTLKGNVHSVPSVLLSTFWVWVLLSHLPEICGWVVHG